MKQSLTIIGIIFILVAGIALIIFSRKDAANLPVNDFPSVTQSDEVRSNPQFEWRYETSEKAQIPQTQISLIASYSDQTSKVKVIDMVEGSCNIYDKRDADVYIKSDEIICYYAGLGRYYKVVKAEDGFKVKRKIFEEASPEYNPPQQEFEIIDESF